MKILVTAPGRFAGGPLKVGCRYNAELADEGTDAQNRAFHALLQCYWKAAITGEVAEIHNSSAYVYDAKNFEHFRALIKMFHGAGNEKFWNLSNPDGSFNPKGRLDYRLKSWSGYTKKQRQMTIDNLICEMMLVGVSDRHFDEILQGMDEKQAERLKEKMNETRGGGGIGRVQPL